MHEGTHKDYIQKKKEEKKLKYKKQQALKKKLKTDQD
jgi:hypothetical protein